MKFLKNYEINLFYLLIYILIFCCGIYPSWLRRVEVSDYLNYIRGTGAKKIKFKGEGWRRVFVRDENYFTFTLCHKRKKLHLLYGRVEGGGYTPIEARVAPVELVNCKYKREDL